MQNDNIVEKTIALQEDLRALTVDAIEQCAPVVEQIGRAHV